MSAALNAADLTRGMTIEEVRIELGREESTMELGDRQILIYSGGTQLEFRYGKLVKKNGDLLPKPSAPEESQPEAVPATILETEPPRIREEQTITESATLDTPDIAAIGQDSNRNEAFKQLENEMEDDAGKFTQSGRESSHRHLLAVGISFGVEAVVTFIVLSIAFSISGFPTVVRQLALLSLAVALSGTVLDFILNSGPTNLLRAAAGFIILLVLIKQMTDVREWATAIKIAIIARLVSIVVVWLVIVGLMSILSL